MPFCEVREKIGQNIVCMAILKFHTFYEVSFKSLEHQYFNEVNGMMQVKLVWASCCQFRLNELNPCFFQSCEEKRLKSK